MVLIKRWILVLIEMESQFGRDVLIVVCILRAIHEFVLPLPAEITTMYEVFQDGSSLSFENTCQLVNRMQNELSALVSLHRLLDDHPVEKFMDELVFTPVVEVFT